MWRCLDLRFAFPISLPLSLLQFLFEYIVLTMIFDEEHANELSAVHKFGFKVGQSRLRCAGYGRSGQYGACLLSS
jgi:hypothetical protein